MIKSIYTRLLALYEILIQMFTKNEPTSPVGSTPSTDTILNYINTLVTQRDIEALEYINILDRLQNLGYLVLTDCWNHNGTRVTEFILNGQLFLLKLSAFSLRENAPKNMNPIYYSLTHQDHTIQGQTNEAWEYLESYIRVILKRSEQV